MSVKYIFRLDDATAFSDIEKWKLLEEIFDDFGIKPLVAVTPDNRDPGLFYKKESPNFWKQVNDWKIKGWEIAMHGYQHLYHEVDKKKLLIPYYDRSEFAGLKIEDQRKKIRKSIAIFRLNGIDPKVWIAPSHSFDELTLKAIKHETQIDTVSDGIGIYPFTHKGFTFVPQQLWDVKKKFFGIWTICLHPDTMKIEDIALVRKKIQETKIYENTITIQDLEAQKKYLINFTYSGFYWTKYKLFNFLRPLKKLITSNN